ncbi:MAG: CAP domain-containing protein [Actinomycetota bacterium]|nr:CAP domain-containing protein [Actinomycetota bacterium]
MLTLLLLAAVLVAGYFVPRLEIGSNPQPVGGSTSTAPTQGCPSARVLPSDSLRAAEEATLCLLNANRRKHRLAPLRPNTALHRAALRHSQDMVRRDFFSHVNPDGQDSAARITETGYAIGAGGGATGENLAFGEESESAPAAIVDSWMHSPGHRRNILRPAFREIGIGIVAEPVRRSRPESRGATYTTTFGVRGLR